jgi:hypothetical protein
MRDYAIAIRADGKGLTWLAETVVQGLDMALKEGRASKAELDHLPLAVYAVGDEEEPLGLTPLEKAEFGAVFERRTGRKFEFRDPDDG